MIQLMEFEMVYLPIFLKIVISWLLQKNENHVKTARFCLREFFFLISSGSKRHLLTFPRGTSYLGASNYPSFCTLPSWGTLGHTYIFPHGFSGWSLKWMTAAAQRGIYKLFHGEIRVQQPQITITVRIEFGCHGVILPPENRILVNWRPFLIAS